MSPGFPHSWVYPWEYPWVMWPADPDHLYTWLFKDLGVDFGVVGTRGGYPSVTCTHTPSKRTKEHQNQPKNGGDMAKFVIFSQIWPYLLYFWPKNNVLGVVLKVMSMRIDTRTSTHKYPYPWPVLVHFLSCNYLFNSSLQWNLYEIYKGVAEHGKETNTHFFFFGALPDTLPPSTFLI